VKESTEIVMKLMQGNGAESQITNTIKILLETTLNPNHFQYNNSYYTPKGLVMGSSISGQITGIFYKDLEHKLLEPIIVTSTTVY